MTPEQLLRKLKVIFPNADLIMPCIFLYDLNGVQLTIGLPETPITPDSIHMMCSDGNTVYTMNDGDINAGEFLRKLIS